MKQKENRFKVDKLFILGAGASHAATSNNTRKKSNTLAQQQTPLDAQFSDALIELENTINPKWVKDSVRAVKRAWLISKIAGLKRPFWHEANLDIQSQNKENIWGSQFCRIHGPFGSFNRF